MRASTRIKWVALPLAAAFVAGAAIAGDEGPAPGAAASARAGGAAKGEGNAVASAKISTAGFLRSLRLPALAHQARDKGIPRDQVKLAVASLREAKVTPEEAIETLEATVASVDAKGPVENFGAFVQSKLKEGVRGPKLARAIRDEHDKRGIGKGKRLGKDDEGHPGIGQDPAAKALHLDGKGKADDKTDRGSNSADHPDKGAGKADEKGSKGAEKADEKPAKAGHGADHKPPGHPDGKHDGPGDAKGGKGKEK